MENPVDLRSDTVTRPTPEMRRAMAEAEVGDDVMGEDPTVRELESRTARILGKEAALFVPSGTMGNEIALRVQARSGDEVLVEGLSHIMNAEAGGPAALSGITLRPVTTPGGVYEPALVSGLIRDALDPHDAPTAMLCVENTHNRQGGRVYPPSKLRGLAEDIHGRGMKMHMDGARLWNAAAATGLPEAELAAPADSVMVCFSKGLGAPVGSAVAGSRDFITGARRARKLFGGGMRQAGILAAACLHALDHHRRRLPEDHRRARRLAELSDPPADVRILGSVPETNIVIWELPERLPVLAVRETLAVGGILLSDLGPGILRAVLHFEIDDDGVERAGRAIRAALRVTKPHHTPVTS